MNNNLKKILVAIFYGIFILVFGYVVWKLFLVDYTKNLFTKQANQAVVYQDKFRIVYYLTLRIKTISPDPLLLQKLSLVLIIPSEYEREEIIDNPIGTGPYKFKSWEVGTKITLEKNNDYWGDMAKFNEVEIYSQ